MITPEYDHAKHAHGSFSGYGDNRISGLFCTVAHKGNTQIYILSLQSIS